MNSASSQVNPDDIDIEVIWQAVKRNSFKLAIATAGVVAIVVLALSFATPQYASRAQIIIENQRAGFKQPNGAAESGGGSRVDAESIISQVQVLQSNDLARKVAENLKLKTRSEFNSALGGNSISASLRSFFGLGGNSSLPEMEQVLEVYHKKLTVYPIKDSRVISVEFRSRDPEFAAKLANTLSENYIEWLRSSGLALNKGAQKWLGQEIEQLRLDVEAAEKRLEKMKATTGLIPGQNNLTLNVQQLGEINSRLSLAKARKSEAVARANLVRSMMREGAIETAPDVLKSRLIQRLLEQRVLVQRQIAELSATLLPAHPRMRQLRSELAGLRRQIRNEGRKLVKGLENEAKIASAKEASLIASIKSVRMSTENQSDSQARIRVLEREAKSKREVYEAYVARLGDVGARQSRLSVPIMARIFERATASSIPVFPKKGAIILLSIVSTLFLGLVFIVTRELLRGARSNMERQRSTGPVTMSVPMASPVKEPGPDPLSVLESMSVADSAPMNAIPSVKASPPSAASPGETEHGMEEVPEMDTDPVIAPTAATAPAAANAAERVSLAETERASLAEMKSAAKAAAVLANGENMVAASPASGNRSSLSAIARRLADGANGVHGHRVLVASDVSSEESVNRVVDLARKLGRMGKSVIIVDSEKDEYSLSEMMELSDAQGMYDLLEGRAGFADVLHPVPGEALHMIPVGKSETKLDDQALAEQLELILDALDETYDHIVVYGGYANAQELFRILEGRFDAGVTIGDELSLPGALRSADVFLGFKVLGIDVQHYMPETPVIPPVGGPESRVSA